MLADECNSQGQFLRKGRLRGVEVGFPTKYHIIVVTRNDTLLVVLPATASSRDPIN